jgi:cardiolipin synthase
MRPTADTLTTLRFVLSPIVMWLILADERAAALSFYGAAIVTDILDGYLARKSKVIPSYGPTFDVLADMSLFYLPITALAIAGRGFWLLVGATISVAYLVPVLAIIRKKKGGLTIPRLDTALLATSVHTTVIAHIVGWQYAQFLVLPLFVGALIYVYRYVMFPRNA